MKHTFRRNIVLLVCCLLGALLVPYLSIQLNPSPRTQRLSVSYSYPDASPEVIEQEVTSRLESAFATLRGLVEIKSTSDAGNGQITLNFDRKADIEKIRMEIAMLIRQIYPRLNEHVSYPQITYQSEFEEYNTLLIYTLSSDWPANRLEQLVDEQIAPSLSRETGVRQIELTGLRTQEYRIIINEQLRSALGLTTAQIQQAIRQHLSQQELGLAGFQLEGQKERLSVRYGARVNTRSPESDLGQIPLARQGGRTILLSDVAVVKKNLAKARGYFRINGQTAVTLHISADQKTNQVRLAQKVKEKMAVLQTGLAGSVRFDLVRDETAFLSDELQKIGLRVGATFLLLLLFMIVVRPHRRYLLLVWGSLAASLLISVLFYYGLGLELHLYSIAGWTLSLGIVLDNLLVMADHIRHHGNQRIFPAVFSATLTTIGALSVIFFIEEQYRETLSDFSWIFMINLLVSLLVALIFVPGLYHGLFHGEQERRFSIRRKKRVLWFTRGFRKYILFSTRFRGAFFFILILSFGLPLFLLPDKWDEERLAARWFNQTFGSDLYRQKIRPPADKYLGGAFRLFHQKKDQFYFQQQRQEKTKLYLQAKMPFGGTTEQLNEIIQTIEAYLSQYPEIDKYESRVTAPDQSSISITFKEEFEKGVFPYTLKSRLESLAVATGSADFSVYGVGLGFNNEVRGSRLSMQIQLLGYNYEELWRLAFEARERFLQHMRIQKAFINAEPSYFEPKEEYYQIRLPKMTELQQGRLSPALIGELLRESKVEKGIAGYLQLDNESYPIALYAADERQDQLWNIRNRPFVLDSNQIYRHAHYLDLSREKGQQKIVRLNQQYQLILSYEFIGNNRLGQKVMEQKLDTLARQLPMGYRIQKLGYGRFWSSKKGQDRLLQILLAALLSIFMINAVLFNSLRQAFIPLLLIPPAYIGVFLCVSFFDFRFDQGGFASFLLVAGLSVNAALFIINDYNNYRQKKPRLSHLDCFLKAFNAKIIPIILTALSTIIGLLPFILFDTGQTFWYSLAICTIGGLTFSTLAVYLFFPLFFLRKRESPLPPFRSFSSKRAIRGGKKHWLFRKKQSDPTFNAADQPSNQSTKNSKKP